MLTLVVAALLSATLIAAFLNLGAVDEAGPDRERAVLGAATAATADQCADLLLLGVDGGGESSARNSPPDPSPASFGRTLRPFVEQVLAQAAAGVRTVDVRRVTITAPSARALVDSPTTSEPARSAVTRARARAWRSGVPEGVRRAVATLDEAGLACPDQQLALVGHAQGASVLHRVLLQLQERPEGLARVVGAALVSDPERRRNSVAGHLLGVPSAPVDSSGVLALVGRAAADVPPDTATLQIWSLCTRSDLVCNPRRTTVEAALRASRSYRSPGGADLVREAAVALWQLARLVPVPQPRVQVLTRPTDQPLSVQLVVDVAPESAGSVVWSDPQQLPPGLLLDERGLLSGTPTEAGTWNLTYVVSNTAPPTSGVTGVVVLTARPTSVMVSTGGQASCEVSGDHTLRCWGRNNFGQLGDGTLVNRTTPVQVGADADWDSVSTGGSTTCGIRTDRTLWCWGLDNFGQLGIGRGKPRSTPVRVGTATNWASVSTNWFHTCATRTDATLWCWGLNDRGQLGDGTLELRGRPTQVGEARDWLTVSAGGWHTCGTRGDGTAWCWGQNVFGQLGNDDPVLRVNPTQVGVAGDWVQVSAGWAHTCGLTSQGRASCWGLNGSGQLGDGSRRPRRSPEAVSGDRIWTSLSTGDASSCGVDNTGAAYCWGSNRYGQLGDGSLRDQRAPVMVRSEGRWLWLDAGWFHVCGGLESGIRQCWGNNEAGQVGNGSTADKPLPKEVK